MRALKLHLRGMLTPPLDLLERFVDFIQQLRVFVAA